MPVCSFFLRGLCSKEDCPYLHVSVGREAQLCMDFVKGYCPRGEEVSGRVVMWLAYYNYGFYYRIAGNFFRGVKYSFFSWQADLDENLPHENLP